MKRLVLISLTLLLAFSCTKAVIQEQGKGALKLKLSIPSLTKSGVEELLDSTLVNIYYADYSGLVRTYRYCELPSEVYLPVNTYRVDVVAGEASKAHPRRINSEITSYEGSKEVVLVMSETSVVEIEAFQSCALLSVNFDPGMDEELDEGYKMTVHLTESDSVVFTRQNNSQTFYCLISDLEEPCFKWKFEGTRTFDEKKASAEGKISELKAANHYSMKVKYTITEGFVTGRITVDESVTQVEDLVVFEGVATGLEEPGYEDIWACHANVSAVLDEGEYPDISKVKVSYCEQGSGSSSLASLEKVSEGQYRAALTSLNPTTAYTCSLVCDGVTIGDPISFTTDSAPRIPNGSFEYTSSAGDYTNLYDPSAPDPIDRTAWWGNGNGADGVSGSASMGYPINEIDTSTKIDGNQSDLLESDYAVVKFAAGNLFSGTFGGMVGTTGGIVNFGRPFTARPTALKLWLKYSTGKVNHIDSYPPEDPVTTDDYDRARVQIALGVWAPKTYGGNKESPIRVNTTDKSTFINFNTDPSTLAYKELVLKGDAQNSHNSWKEYTLTLDYRDTNTQPQYIVVSLAASMLGDYFTGCDESKLWVDKVEFIYE